MAPDDRPKWSITWLFRIQRVGRNGGDEPPDGRAHSWFKWAVFLLLLVEIGLLVWLGIIPR